MTAHDGSPYPIRIPRDPSQAKRGADRRRRLNILAEVLEDKINRELARRGSGVHQFMYGFLASELGESVADVREVMTRHPAGGHNGITIQSGQDLSGGGDSWR